MGCASSSDSATKTTASSQSLNASQDQAQNDTSARGDRLMPLPVGSDQTRSTGRDAASGSKRVSIGQKELGNANDGVHQKVLVQVRTLLSIIYYAA